MSPVQVRLSDDAHILEILLSQDPITIPPQVIFARIQQECAALHIEAVVSFKDVLERTREAVANIWITVLEATPPTPPTPDRIRLLLPVRVTLAGSRELGPVVHAGMVLAQLEPGTPGKAGHDLLGNPIPPRPPRAVHLPHGEYTAIDEDGRSLRATRDGYAVMRNLLIHVVPMAVHEGDVTIASGVVETEEGLIVTGSVRELGVVRAEGDVHVLGEVQAAHVTSVHGTITIARSAAGTEEEPCVLRAEADILCGPVSRADVEAHGNILVRGEIHHSKIAVDGDLHVPRALERSLRDVELYVGRGVFSPLAPPETPPIPLNEWQHARVPVSVRASLAVDISASMAFTPALIVELSPAGARCRFPHGLPDGTVNEAFAEIKFRLPGSNGDIVVVAQVMGIIPPHELAISFVQISDRDMNRISRFRDEEIAKLKDFQPGSRIDRRG